MLVFSSGCSSLAGTRQTELARRHLQSSADFLAQREYGQAIEFAQAALASDPSLAAAQNLMALVYLETKRYDRAEEAFHRALELQPNYPEVFNNLGVLYNRQERFEEAIPFFQKALADDNYLTPENAYTNMGYALYRLGRYPDALTAHQKALDIAPLFCLASKNMADVYAKQKFYPKASQYYEKALSTCPLYQESHYKLGLVLMKMGQRKNARARLEKLVQRHKTGHYVERSAEVLKWLK